MTSAAAPSKQQPAPTEPPQHLAAQPSSAVPQSPPTKRDLKSWWKRFQVQSKHQETQGKIHLPFLVSNAQKYSVSQPPYRVFGSSGRYGLWTQCAAWLVHDSSASSVYFQVSDPLGMYGKWLTLRLLLLLLPPLAWTCLCQCPPATASRRTASSLSLPQCR
jgi:hypothetical protein